MPFVLNKFFSVKGNGVHKDKEIAFQRALRDAGVEELNLVRLENIITLTKGAKRISKDEGMRSLIPGQVVYAAIGINFTDESMRLISASIGWAIPRDSDQHGYMIHRVAEGLTEEKAGDCAEDYAAQMCAGAQGIEFDPDTAWDEREELFKLSGKFFQTANVTQSATGNKDHLYTAVFGAAIFLENGL